MAFCSECKCCEAQPSMADDPAPLCIFCEDGVACPNRQRAARPAITTTPAHITPLPPKKPGRTRNPNSPWRGMASLHLSDKSPQKPATTHSGATLQEEAPEPQQVDEVSTAGDDRQEEKERTTMPPKDDEEIPRYCGREGCTKTLTRANKSGFCTPHWYDSKKKSANGSAPKKPRVFKPAPPPQFQFQDRGSGNRSGHAARHGSAPQQLPFKTQPGREDRYRSAAS